MRFRTLTCTAALLAALAAADAASAQTNDSAPAPQGPASQTQTTDSTAAVVVTARRREENLQKIPVEVSVIRENDVHQLNILLPVDIGNVVSGLQADTSPINSRSAVTYSIRGQGGSTGVVTYFDEVPNFASGIYDLQNIQVLKGSQGTLFGEVTTGGAILLQSALPTDHFGGFADVRVGSYNEHNIEFGVGGPIVPGMLSFRIAGLTNNSDGFTHNTYDNSPGDGTDNQSVRLTLKADVGPFEDILLGSINRDADENTLAIPLIANPNATNPIIKTPIPAAIAAANNIACTPICPTWISVMQQQLANQARLGRYSASNNDFGSGPVNAVDGLINTASFKASDWLTVRDIFSYTASRTTNGGENDQDGYGLPITDGFTEAEDGGRTLTNELQLHLKPMQNMQVTAGYYYEHDWTPQYESGAFLTFGGYTLLGLPPPIGIVEENIGYISLASKSNDTNQGFYIQDDWQILPKLTLTGGLRYTTVDAIGWTAGEILGAASPIPLPVPVLSSPTNTLPTQRVLIPGAPPGLALGQTSTLPAALAPESQVKGNQFTYTVAGDYQLTDDISLYVTARTGYKPGGLNPTPPTPQFAQFGPEDVFDVEGGVKTHWQLAGVTGTLDLAVYSDDYTNIQRTFTVTNPNTGLPAAITGNVAAATIRGFDLDSTIVFSPAFDVTGYWSLTDAFYTKFPNTGQFVSTYGPIAATYNLTKMLLSDVSQNRWGVRPDVRLKGLLPDQAVPDLVLSANIYGRSKYADTNINGALSPISILPGRTLADLRLDWNHVYDTNLSLAAGVINVGDYEGLIAVNDQSHTSGYAYGMYQEPRTFYLEMHYAF